MMRDSEKSKTEQLCRSIERIIKGSADEKLLTYEQAMIDVKLPLCLDMLNFQQSPESSEQTMLDLTEEMSSELLSALYRLSTLCEVYGARRPAWMDSLISLAECVVAKDAKTNTGTNALEKELIDEVFDGQSLELLRRWATGQAMDRNPFVSEMILS